jgi:hypothetical protein
MQYCTCSQYGCTIRCTRFLRIRILHASPVAQQGPAPRSVAAHGRHQERCAGAPSMAGAPSAGGGELLALVVDADPVTWRLRAGDGDGGGGDLQLSDVLDDVLIFVNAFLLLSSSNRLVVVMCTQDGGRVLYPLPEGAEQGMMAGGGGNSEGRGGRSGAARPSLAAVAELLGKGVRAMAAATASSDGIKTEGGAGVGGRGQRRRRGGTQLADGLSRALCMINRYCPSAGRGAAALVGAPTSEGGLAGGGGTARRRQQGGPSGAGGEVGGSRLLPRVLTVGCAPDDGAQYRAIMNAVFAVGVPPRCHRHHRHLPAPPYMMRTRMHAPVRWPARLPPPPPPSRALVPQRRTCVGPQAQRLAAPIDACFLGEGDSACAWPLNCRRPPAAGRRRHRQLLRTPASELHACLPRGWLTDSCRCRCASSPAGCSRERGAVHLPVSRWRWGGGCARERRRRRRRGGSAQGAAVPAPALHLPRGCAHARPAAPAAPPVAGPQAGVLRHQESERESCCRRWSNVSHHKNEAVTEIPLPFHSSHPWF